MTQAAFDTRGTAKRLHEEFDFPQKQAEGAARLVHEHLAGTVGTKEDIKALKAESADTKAGAHQVDGGHSVGRRCNHRHAGCEAVADSALTFAVRGNGPCRRAGRPIRTMDKGISDNRGARTMGRLAKLGAFLASTAILAGCDGSSGGPSAGGETFFNREMSAEQRRRLEEAGLLLPEDRETVFDLFDTSDDPNTTVAVNLYLWHAALEILDFMPVEAADPFSGIIAFGYGVPPGGARAYRATVHIQDPALEARALSVAVHSRDGAISRADARRPEVRVRNPPAWR